MDNDKITLEGFLSVIKYTQPITINLFAKAATAEEEDQSLISFLLPGYDCLDDFLLDDQITNIEIVSLKSFNVTIDTSED